MSNFGDNIFYGHDLLKILRNAIKRKNAASIFAYHVIDPERYGVVELNDELMATNIEEKPQSPKSNWAVTGLYVYDSDVVEIAKTIKPSHIGEYEITDINKHYLERKQLFVEIMGRGFAWLDTGTHDFLLEAGHFVQTIEKRQSLKISCIEEIALSNKWITKQDLEKIVNEYGKSSYANYMRRLI